MEVMNGHPRIGPPAMPRPIGLPRVMAGVRMDFFNVGRGLSEWTGLAGCLVDVLMDNWRLGVPMDFSPSNGHSGLPAPSVQTDN